MTDERIERFTTLVRTIAADQELTNAAAKAAGLWDAENDCVDIPWLPLVSDGDALRLAVSLQITIHVDDNLTEAVNCNGDICTEAHFADPYAATRRAVVRAAALATQKDTPHG